MRVYINKELNINYMEYIYHEFILIYNTDLRAVVKLLMNR